MTNTWRLAAGLAGLALLVIGVSLARAQAGKADIVYFYNRAKKKADDVRGKIKEESAAGIKIMVREGGKDVEKTIAADDITRIDYTTSLSAIEYRSGFSKEDAAANAKDEKKKKALYGEAIAIFTATEDKVRLRPEAKRYMQYKAAMATLKLAEIDPSRKDDAVKRLKAFTEDNRSGWQMKPALQTLARLYEDAGKEDDARDAYESLARLPGVPVELANQSAMLVAKLYLRKDKFDKAETALAGLKGKLAADAAERPLVEAYLVECKIGQNKLDGLDKSLPDAIKKAEDNQLRGVLHNLMGEYLLKKGDAKEAFWHFLRVDALYNESADEQARAIYRLGDLFKKRGDLVRSKQCYERLADKAYARTIYQKLADEKLKEK
jgi:hypothetical protein